MALPALFGVVMFLIGLFVCLVSGRHVWRTAALLRADTVDRLGGVDDGRLVRVTGTVEATESTLTAPFSGVDCVALRPVVEERRPGALLVPTYVTIHDPSASVGFAVRTPHGAVSVDDPARTVSLLSTVVGTVDPDAEPPERIARYERETDDLSAETVWRSPPAPLAPVLRALSLGTRRYSERCASPGDEVTVAGRVVDGHLDPLVVSTTTPRGALRRLSKTSLAGLLVGAFALALGAVLLLAS
jgi:hypothetical protein